MADDEVTCNVVGFEELKAGSIALFGKIENRAVSQLGVVARQRRDMVRAAVPVVSGRMQASVMAGRLKEATETTAAVEASALTTGAMTGLGGGAAPYAGWVEFGGTRGRDYVPEGRWLYPIALAAGLTVQRDMSNAAKNVIKGYEWPPPVAPME